MVNAVVYATLHILIILRVGGPTRTVPAFNEFAQRVTIFHHRSAYKVDIYSEYIHDQGNREFITSYTK